MLRKGKHLCWKHVKDNKRFLELFSSLGTEVQINDDQLNGLEEFVCVIFGQKKLSSVNDARRELFWERMERNNKITDLSFLSPCKSSLAKHISYIRSNYIAYMWRNAYRPIINLESPTNHGWLPDLKIDWVEEPYPEDVTELLAASDNKTLAADFLLDYSDSSDSDSDF